MGDVVVLFIGMVITGAAVFAPLGYFMYMFSGFNTKPFWVPQHEGEHHSMVNDFAEYVIAFVKSKIAGKKSAT